MAIAKPTTTPNREKGRPYRNVPLVGRALFALAPTTARARDPIVPLYRQWLSARKTLDYLVDLPGGYDSEAPDAKAAQTREDEAFWAMIELTPTSVEGIAALAHVLWELEGPAVLPDHEDFQEEADSPNCKLMRAIWRAAAGRDGLPGGL
ncbi:hypothetical protein [Amorphus sp. 3PC139-8]|uniref:hypothetical protein n=1 Tax=Amorphus sp. 3PC139-8 TaxID=2735676 RepID=UPI00345CA123